MTTITFEQAANSFIQQGGEAHYLRKIIPRFSGRMITEITAGEIKALAIDMLPEAKNSTRNRQVITPCRAVLNHAHEMGWRPNWTQVRSLRLQEVRRYAPPDEQWLSTFVAFCDGNKLSKIAALILFMNHTGARVSEAVNLKGEDVDLEARSAILRKTKTDRNSRRTLSTELVRRIRLIGLKPGEPVFGQRCRHNVNDRLKNICRRAGLDYRSSHYVGRAAFATNALNMGVGIRTAMDAGGWRTARLFLEVYVHTANAGVKVADAIDAHYPKPKRDFLRLVA